MKARALTAALGSVGLLIAAAGVVLFPSLAGAHHNTVVGTSACADATGTYTVTWEITNSEAGTDEEATLTPTGGGTLSATVIDIPMGGKAQVTQSGIPGSATTATLSVAAEWTNGQTNTSSGSVALSGDCTIDATPATPTIAQAVCTAPGQATTPTYTIPTTTGVNYLVGNSVVEAGSYTLAQGSSVTVTAAAKPGYSLEGSPSWTLTATVIDCTSTVTVTPAVFANEKCVDRFSVAGTLVIAAKTGVTYTVSPASAVIELQTSSTGSAAINAGSYTVTPGVTVTVTAAAAPGYAIDGTKVFSHTYPAALDCTEKVTPAIPAITQAVCTAPGQATTPKYTIPTTTGVNYLVGNVVVDAGTYDLAQGSSVTITAQAKAGYTLEGSPSWTLKADVVDCISKVTVTPAVFANEKCVDRSSVAGTLVIAAKTGVTYTVAPASSIIELQTSNTGSAAINAGSYTVTPGTSVTVTAVAAPGYAIDGTKVFSHTYPVALDCTEKVTPAVPAVMQTECIAPGEATDGTFTIPVTAGVVYWVNDGESPAQAGTYTLAQGQVVAIHAEALEGYTLNGTDEWTFTGKVIDCTVTATPATPTYTVQQCLYPSYTVQPATVTVPSTPGVVYSLDGVVVAAGTSTVGTGSHAVTAAAVDGYELIDYPAGGWTTTIAAVPCEVAVLAQPPVAAPSLASTGSNASTLAVLGFLVLGAGGAMVALTARRGSKA